MPHNLYIAIVYSLIIRMTLIRIALTSHFISGILILMDSTTTKLFNNAIETPIAIRSDGIICIDSQQDNHTTFNIKDVIEYTLAVDDTNDTPDIAGGIGKGAIAGMVVGGLLGTLVNTGRGPFARKSQYTNLHLPGAVVGGLVGGGNAAKTTNNINSISLLFKLNDFNNPLVTVPLLTQTIDQNSNFYKQIATEIQQIIATLDFLWQRREQLQPDPEVFQPFNTYTNQIENNISDRIPPIPENVSIQQPYKDSSSNGIGYLIFAIIIIILFILFVIKFNS